MTTETLIRGADDTLEIEAAQVQTVKRVVRVEATFAVHADGTVRLVDPPGHRLRHGTCNGHPIITLGGFTYFTADLVAQAHLDSKYGFIGFHDGDITNCAADNLTIDMSDVDHDRIVSLMRPDHLPAHKFHGVTPSKARRERMFLC